MCEKFGNALASLNTIVQFLPHNIEGKILHDNDAKEFGLPGFINIREHTAKAAQPELHVLTVAVNAY